MNGTIYFDFHTYGFRQYRGMWGVMAVKLSGSCTFFDDAKTVIEDVDENVSLGYVMDNLVRVEHPETFPLAEKVVLSRIGPAFRVKKEFSNTN